MKIELNRSSRIPLARQISQAIADRILSGYFQKGSRLPSVRELSRTLEVSPVTVVQALKILESQSLVNRVQGKGTFVYGESPKQQDPTAETLLPIPDYLHRTQHWHYHQEPARINFSLCAVHPSLLPGSALTDSMRHLLQHDPDILVQYGEIQGDLELRQVMAQYLNSEKLKVSPQEILVTNGAQQGIDLVIRSFIGPGDIVVTESPAYTAAIDAFRSRGATILSVSMDEEGMRMDELTALLDTYKPKLIYTNPSFQNPTGKVMSLKRRKELLDLAVSTGALILEDDSWSEIYYDGPPPPHIKSLDQHGHVIYLKGISKILSPGCRVGFLIASGSVLNPLIAAKTHADLGSPLLNQRVMIPLLKPDNITPLLKQLRTSLKKRRNRVIELLNEYAPDAVRWITPRGGFNLWLTLPETVNTNALLRETEKKHIQFLPGSACYAGEAEWNHLRICFSHVPESHLEEGIREFCSLLSSHLATAENRRSHTPIF
ncbi:PLP-dependent aminotransferase family protein [Kroppenstedtia pulmonis]|uniref:PLP-dependent aminotransferase family protein n=1 Tax=Kroppenstedtia pulmonis TaxID=1380685 RepID=A0A7D4BXC2_9BACL|nr:PLP-dependent aminotransferase family protein [Kroppenstedtia pulmonis]QKG85373.1 PLP-dependent aminotransferase family protein [Kroppenstedtia pulmonis]